MRLLFLALLISCTSIAPEEPWYKDENLKLHTTWVDGCLEASEFWITEIFEHFTGRRPTAQDINAIAVYELCSERGTIIYPPDGDSKNKKGRIYGKKI